MIPLLVFGLVIGSFLNVLIYRIPRGENFLTSRSYCDHCRKTLAWYDLIPVVSYLFLSGKCRYCKKKINSQILLVELITGLLFAGYFLKVQTIDLNFFLNLFVISSLIVIFFSDANYEIIPDKVLAPLAVASIILNFNTNFLSFLLSGIGGFIFFLLIYLISRGGAMGFGDVKFAGVLGLVLGYPLTLISFYLSFLTGGIVGLILVLWKKKKLKGDTIPFGPFLSLGAIVSLFLGDLLVSRLLNFLQ